MNKYLNYLVAYLLSLAALSSCSDDNEPTPVPVPDPTRVATASCSTCRAVTPNTTFS